MTKGYLIIDIGTGNTRVGIAAITGEIIAVENIDTTYDKDTDFPDSISFNPIKLRDNIFQLVQELMKKYHDIDILAVSSTSQRQGIILLDKIGEPILGLPNIDMRGLEWEKDIQDVKKVYALTGRWTNSLFSAQKLRGTQYRQPHIWEQISTFTSISDWIGYELTGQLVYEPSQASETSLFDIEEGNWSQELCDIFGIDISLLPEIKQSGSILGKIKPILAEELNLPAEAVFIVGGADTQLAVKGTQPELDDIVIVSGTTSPITKVVDTYSVDPLSRCWMNRYVDPDQFLIETNAGVSGLNYQRLKNVFFPGKTYTEIEEEVLKLENPTCVASFGTFVFDKNLPLSKGGFMLDAPAHQDLTAADFMFSILFDIASSIKHNFDVLLDISDNGKSYVLGCGGGFQGRVLPQLLADLLRKEIYIKDGFEQASMSGAVIICNDALNLENHSKETIKIYKPRNNGQLDMLYEKWSDYRNKINNITESEKVYA